MNPYFALQVTEDADDVEIRRAYLDAIRIATPEDAPARFQQLSAAYETVKTAALRRKHEFERRIVYDESPLCVTRRCLTFHPPKCPPDFEFMKKRLRDCLKRSPS